VHPILPREVAPSLAPGEGQPDLTHLLVRELGERVPVPGRVPPVAQAVRRVALAVAEVQVLRPVVPLVVVAVADELPGASSRPSATLITERCSITRLARRPSAFSRRDLLRAST
jgi:hypothetical protein